MSLMRAVASSFIERIIAERDTDTAFPAAIRHFDVRQRRQSGWHHHSEIIDENVEGIGFAIPADLALAH